MAAVNPMDVIKNTPNVFQFKEEKSWLERGVSLVTGVVIVLVAHILGTVIKKYIFKLGEEKIAPERGKEEVPITGTEASVQNQQTKITFVILGHFVYYVVLIIGLMAVFKIVGLETTGLLAVIGATGFAIGLALQGVLSDVAAGILVAIFQIYTIGELIDYNGQIGRVKEFTLFYTTLLDVPTNTTIVVPNRKIQEGPVKNLSRQKLHFVIVDVLVSNENSDFTKILQVIREAAGNSPFLLKDSPLSVFMLDMSTGGVTIRAKVPIASRNIVAAPGAIRLAIRNALAREKVAMLDCVLKK